MLNNILSIFLQQAFTISRVSKTTCLDIEVYFDLVGEIFQDFQCMFQTNGGIGFEIIRATMLSLAFVLAAYM